MEPINFLDEIVARFRHRWETNPQYRAMMSGVVGLVTIVGLCSCMGVASAVANSVFVSNGLGGGTASAASQQNTGGRGIVVGVPTFPTSAVPTWQVSGLPPAVVAPTSQTVAPTATPIPSATAAPTATCPSSGCGGGGGGGGGGGTVTWTYSYAPSNWGICANGGTCSFSVHTSAPNVGVYIQINFCNQGSPILSPPGQTNANGDWTYQFTGSGPGTSASVEVYVYGGANQTVSVKCR